MRFNIFSPYIKPNVTNKMNKTRTLYEESNQCPKKVPQNIHGEYEGLFSPVHFEKAIEHCCIPVCKMMKKKWQQFLWSKCEAHRVVNRQLNGAQCNKQQHSLFALLCPNPSSITPHLSSHTFTLWGPSREEHGTSGCGRLP